MYFFIIGMGFEWQVYFLLVNLIKVTYLIICQIEHLFMLDKNKMKFLVKMDNGVRHPMLINWSRWLLTKLSNSLSLPTYLPTYHFTNLPTSYFPPTILHTYLPPTSHLPSYILTYLPTYLLTSCFPPTILQPYIPISYFPLTILHLYLPTYLLLPTYRPTSLHTHLPPTSHVENSSSTS